MTTQVEKNTSSQKNYLRSLIHQTRQYGKLLLKWCRTCTESTRLNPSHQKRRLKAIAPPFSRSIANVYGPEIACGLSPKEFALTFLRCSLSFPLLYRGTQICNLFIGFFTGNNGAAEAPLLVQETVEEMVDYKGQKARRSSTGGWRSVGFIIGVEIAERFVFFGIICNLITYLTGAQPLAKA
ncbi:hypothetical protein Scep_004564 [Stephania cephalantha]|uniref:Uncharacterized protein n=1 Tax=Stephania cephalantha TaxID=152367 RepID=A0AAP0PWR5_9MAGN